MISLLQYVEQKLSIVQPMIKPMQMLSKYWSLHQKTIYASMITRLETIYAIN